MKAYPIHRRTPMKQMKMNHSNENIIETLQNHHKMWLHLHFFTSNKSLKRFISMRQSLAANFNQRSVSPMGQESGLLNTTTLLFEVQSETEFMHLAKVLLGFYYLLVASIVLALTLILYTRNLFHQQTKTISIRQQQKTALQLPIEFQLTNDTLPAPPAHCSCLPNLCLQCVGFDLHYAGAYPTDVRNKNTQRELIQYIYFIKIFFNIIFALGAHGLIRKVQRL